MEFTRTIYVPTDVANVIDLHLNAKNPDDFQGEDNTITYTAIFQDGIEVDVKCCGCDDAPSWTEAVAFEHGSEVGLSEVEDTFFGSWSISVDDNTYNVIVEKKGE